MQRQAQKARNDIALLRNVVDTALDSGVNQHIVDACRAVLHDRQEQLWQLELARRERHRRLQRAA